MQKRTLLGKECNKCRLYKPLEEYSENRSRKDGLDHYCRDCRNELQREYNQVPEHKEQYNLWQRRYYNDSPQGRLVGLVSRVLRNYINGRRPWSEKVSEDLCLTEEELEQIRADYEAACVRKNDRLQIHHKYPRSWYNLIDPFERRHCSRRENLEFLTYKEHLLADRENNRNRAKRKEQLRLELVALRTKKEPSTN